MWWSDRQKQRLTELHAKGLSMRAIGRAMNLGHDQVIGQCHRLGLPKRANPCGPKLPVDVDAVRRMSDAGLGPTRIAAAMGFSVDLIQRYLCRMGLTNRGRGRLVPEPLPASVRTIPLLPSEGRAPSHG